MTISILNTIDLSNLLTQNIISSKAPCRFDFGGYWDIKGVALTNRYVMPKTVNFAVDLMLSIHLKSFDKDKIKVTSVGYTEESYYVWDVPLNTAFALPLAICQFFQVSGLHVEINSSFPPQSGLGGSGVLAVALIHALTKALIAAGHNIALTPNDIVRLAHDIEDGLRLSLTGLQDQAAATFGGANLWSWHYDEPHILFRQECIWDDSCLDKASEHFLLVYTGFSHSSNKVNLKVLDNFFSGKNRVDWERVNQLTLEFFEALKSWDWEAAIRAVNEEVAIRQRITPNIFTPAMNQFVSVALKHSCGARFTGAGGGGCIWAVGELDRIQELKIAWAELVKHSSDARLLTMKFAEQGVM